MDPRLIRYARIRQATFASEQLIRDGVLNLCRMNKKELDALEQEVVELVGEGNKVDLGFAVIQITGGGRITWVPLSQNVKQTKRRAIVLRPIESKTS